MWFLVSLLASVALLVVLYQPRYRLLQFLFILRFPLAVALLLAGFPFLAASAPLAPLLGNLLVLSPVQAFVTSTWAVLLSWVVMYTMALLIKESGRRPGIRWRRDEGFQADLLLPRRALSRAALAVARAVDARPTQWASLLALPLAASLVVWAPPGQRIGNLVATGAGFLAATLLRLAWKTLVPLVEGSHGLIGLIRAFAGAIGGVAARKLAGGSEPARVHWGASFTHEAAAVFFSLTALLYALGYFLLSPDSAGNTGVVPALTYLLILVVLVGWILPLVSFLADRPRIPVVLSLVVIAAATYFVFDTDHYFPVEPTESRTLSPAEVIKSRRPPGAAGNEAPVVVVAASGGGITASLWAATVMTGLYEIPDIGPRLAQSTVALSTVSGGGVGLMYLVDRFTPEGPPTGSALREIRDAAGSSSLAATAWGMVYPDFWRILFGFLPVDSYLDRGWALERSWSRGLAVPSVRLSDWQRGVSEGWRPVQIFNSTIAETGQRLVFSPGMRLDDPGVEPQQFETLYPGHTIPVVTAARLSATFPYVSPVARPAQDRVALSPGFHVADGGYFDNLGVMSALDWIEAAVSGGPNGTFSQPVLLIQIRAPETVLEQPKGRRGWLYATLGPLITLLQVRSSVQSSRNAKEIELRADRWNELGIQFETVVFELKADTPLSWHLTDAEKQVIVGGFSESVFKSELDRMRSLFGDRP